ncbi:MAG: hypothetical protein F9K40_04825, partial [Kofleriaceae bacterium]
CERVALPSKQAWKNEDCYSSNKGAGARQLGLYKSLRSAGAAQIPTGSRGQILGLSPQHWTWHHVPHRPGVMQLIPRDQHAQAYKSILHPDNKGGMSLWGWLF